jgi:hypothetical protein
VSAIGQGMRVLPARVWAGAWNTEASAIRSRSCRKRLPKAAAEKQPLPFQIMAVAEDRLLRSQQKRTKCAFCADTW